MFECFNFLFDQLHCEAAWDHPSGGTWFKYFNTVFSDEVEELAKEAAKKWPQFQISTRECVLNGNLIIVLKKA